MHDIFFSLDTNGALVYLNHEAERALHLDRASCLGKNIWDIFPTQANGVYARLYQQAQASNKTTQLPIFADCLDRWVTIKLFPSPEGMLVSFVAAEAPSGDSNYFKQLAQVALHTSLSVIITDAQGATEWVNESFTKQTGYTMEDMLGKEPGAVLHGNDTDPAIVQRYRERRAQQLPFSFTLLNYSKKGQKLWFSIDINPIHNEEGILVRYVSVQQNITLRKEIEASQAALKQRLYMQNQNLRQFSYAVAHDLQAPLAKARTLVTSLTQQRSGSASDDTALVAEDDTLKQLYRHIEQANATLQDLNGLLALQDKEPAAKEAKAVVLAVVCEQVIASFAEPLRQCGGTVVLETKPELTIRANQEYLHHIFYHLLANSLRHSSSERPLLITIKCYVSATGGVVVLYTDNGLGFDRYKAGADAFQLYKHFHDRPQSQDIHLFLAKAYVDAVGGKIEVSSSLNVGTHFLLQLPPE